MEDLTILIPSFNHSKYIDELFYSIDSLGVNYCKVIVIDDFSQDNSAEKIKKYALKNNNVDFLIKESNMGLVDSLIKGLSFVKTKYVYMIASDDLINSTGFKLALQKMKNESKLCFCIFGAKKIIDDRIDSQVYSKEHVKFFSLPVNEIAEKIFYAHPAPILLQSTIFTTKALKDDPNLIDSKLKFDDYPLFIKLFKRLNYTNETFSFVPEIEIVKYRQHSDNSHKNYKKMYTMFEEVYDLLSPNEKIKNYSKSMYWYLYTIKALLSGDFKTMFFLIKKVKISYFKYFHLFLINKVFR